MENFNRANTLCSEKPNNLVQEELGSQTKRGLPVINIKTGNAYVVLGMVIDATNARDGNVLIEYQSVGGGTRYVRDEGEFWVKFRCVA